LNKSIDFCNQYFGIKFSTLSDDGRSFPVHKCVLAARSPVFDAMLQHGEMAEVQQGQARVPDADYDAVREMLRFIYSGAAAGRDLVSLAMADELLPLADKYALERLKALCEQKLAMGLCADNVCDALSLADMHAAEQLKRAALDFLNAHAQEVADTPALVRMARERPHLMAGAFRALATLHGGLQTANGVDGGDPGSPSRKRFKAAVS